MPSWEIGYTANVGGGKILPVSVVFEKDATKKTIETVTDALIYAKKIGTASGHTGMSNFKVKRNGCSVKDVIDQLG